MNDANSLPAFIDDDGGTLDEHEAQWGRDGTGAVAETPVDTTETPIETGPEPTADATDGTQAAEGETPVEAPAARTEDRIATSRMSLACHVLG